MTNFKIESYDLKEILFDAQKYIDKLTNDDNIEKSWYGIKRLVETLDFVISQKDNWEYQNNDFFNTIVSTTSSIKKAITKALSSSKSTQEINKFEIAYNKEKAIENKNINYSIKRKIEQYWRPHYEKQTNSIVYLNYYYDNDGYLVEIDTDGTRVKKNIRLAEISQKTR